MREIQHLLKINVEFEVADGFEPAIQFPVKKQKINLNHGSMDLVDELTVTQTINKKTRRIKLVIVTETEWVRKKRLASKHKLVQISRPQGEMIARKSKNSGVMIPRLLTQRNARSHE